MKDKPLVAIHCLVYNHEPYLRDCFDGFVMQQTDFPFVAIVHDDASTDGSAAVIREYETKYPHIFKPIYEIENQYSKHDGSLERIMNEAIDATGAKYVAICEGDDYWIDSLKLQKQVDFLETNIEFGICYTDYSRLEDRSGVIYDSMYKRHNAYRPTSYEQHLFRPGYLAPMTWLFRLNMMKYLLLAKVYTDGTYAYMLEFLYNTKVAYLPINTAIYRSHVGSATHPCNEVNLLKYEIGVFRTQIYYMQKYTCTDNIKDKILMQGYLRVLPIAIMAHDEVFIKETKQYMKSQDLNIDLIIRELKQGEMKKNSYAYRIGRKILSPIYWLKQIVNKKNAI